MSAPKLSFPYGSGGGGGGGVSGSGTANTIPRWTGASTLGDSGLIDNGTAIYTTTRKIAVGSASAVSEFTAVTGAAAPTANPPALQTLHGNDQNVFRAKYTSTNFNVSGNWLGLGLGYHDNYMKAAIIAEAKDGSGRANMHIALNAAATAANVGLSDARLTVTYDGNVGIGTTSPAYNLQVAGTAAFSNALVQTTVGTTGGSILSVNTAGFSGDRVPLAITGHASQNYNFLQIGVASPGDKFVVSSSGNVGIGTASPQTLLHIGSGGYAGAALGGLRLTNSVNSYFSASDGTRTMFMGADGSAIIGTLTAHDLQIRAGNTTAVTVQQSTLNVGIGTASPTASSTIFKANNSLGAWNAQDLSVDGLSNGDAVYQRWYATAVAGAVGRFGISFSAGVASFVWNSLYNAGVTSSELMRLTGGGNLGIGTTSPTAALDVPASTTTRATLRVRSGVAPTAPNTGDVWFDGTSLFMRNGAGTQTVSFGGGGGATAWVNFNGTGVIAIRASSNVSSITDVAVGQYVVNFTSAMPDINYSAIGTKQNVSTNTDVSLYDCIGAVASVPARTVNASGWLCLEGAAFFDSANVNIAYFR